MGCELHSSYIGTAVHQREKVVQKPLGYAQGLSVWPCCSSFVPVDTAWNFSRVTEGSLRSHRFGSPTSQALRETFSVFHEGLPTSISRVSSLGMCVTNASREHCVRSTGAYASEPRITKTSCYPKDNIPAATITRNNREALFATSSVRLA
jgi:hypothetical protein